MTAVASKMEDLTIDIREEICVRAPLDVGSRPYSNSSAR